MNSALSSAFESCSMFDTNMVNIILDYVIPDYKPQYHDVLDELNAYLYLRNTYPEYTRIESTKEKFVTSLRGFMDDIVVEMRVIGLFIYTIRNILAHRLIWNEEYVCNEDEKYTYTEFVNRVLRHMGTEIQKPCRKLTNKQKEIFLPYLTLYYARILSLVN